MIRRGIKLTTPWDHRLFTKVGQKSRLQSNFFVWKGLKTRKVDANDESPMSNSSKIRVNVKFCATDKQTERQMNCLTDSGGIETMNHRYLVEVDRNRGSYIHAHYISFL